MKKSNFIKQDTTTQKISEHRRVRETKARHKVNEDWQRVELTGKYRKAVARSICWSTTDKIADEVLNGIFLNLTPRNDEKSASEQKKLLRRIVEKRQAQALHANTRNSRDRKAAVAVITNTSKCMKRIQCLRFAC